MKKILLLVILSVFLFSSCETKCNENEWLCTLTNKCVQKGEICSNGLDGGDIDEHGCKPSTGYSWNQEIGACAPSWEVAKACTEDEKKAEACTMEYMPVCGDNGITYGNKCSACASKEIDSYVIGECQKEENSREYLSEDPDECNKMGVWICDEGKTAFSDETGCGCEELECGECPLLTPPSPDWCKGGKIVEGKIDECGCQSPPLCGEVMCTADAKQCSDGSYVGRVGPNCEFAPCPGE